ncbi:MAG: PspA-associated protein PspAB [Acidimicrobiales bacterium]
MKLFDALLGRTKPVKANLDALFAMSSAAVGIEAEGFKSLDSAGVAFKPSSGADFNDTAGELQGLLALDSKEAGSSIRQVDDSYGYHWIVLSDPILEDLVARAHTVNSTLEGHGFGPQLLCSVFGFVEEGLDGQAASAGPAQSRGPAGRTAYLVYLYKRGTFYPFVPLPGERRDNELELRLRAIAGRELPVEADLTRWFPLWGVPVP